MEKELFSIKMETIKKEIGKMIIFKKSKKKYMKKDILKAY